MISSLQLEAFYQVAKQRNFSKAAKSLKISQPALSHRIKNLELDLQTGLIIRDPAGLRITNAGDKLLRYCLAREQIEHELLQDIISAHKDKGGTIRIGAFSSVMRSIVMPAIHPLLGTDPFVSVELLTYEMRDMIASLDKAEVDIILTSEPSKKSGLVTELLGFEENVLAVSKTKKCPEHVFLDHDADDPTTLAFCNLNKLDHSRIKRRFLDEVYALIDGIKLGFGRSIVPKHIVKKHPELKIIERYKTLKIPVYLQHYSQPFYASILKATLFELKKKFKEVLAKD